MNFSKCLISDNFIVDQKFCDDKEHSHKPFYWYTVEIERRTYKFCFCPEHFETTKEYIEENRDEIYKLILKGLKFEKLDEWEDYFTKVPYRLHKHDFESYIEENKTIITSENKLENLFLKLFEHSIHDGFEIPFHESDFGRIFQLKNDFTNLKELFFYLNTLGSKGLIELSWDEGNLQNYSITFEGLSAINKLKEEGANSNRCFIAMSFNPEDEIIFNNGIKPACTEMGYNAIRVDQVHPESDQTINDMIIAEIKRSKFLISDFTKNKSGVYFEAGYGLGRGKKVIYTCSKSDFKDLHFDVNHFPILIYENPEQLKEMLINKFEAFINE